MPNLNSVHLMGNLTRDPELRFLPSNNIAVCNFGIAINRTWTDRQTDEKRSEATYIDIEVFGKTAEIINQYFRKGSPIFVGGRLKLDQWQDSQGNNRSKLKVIAEQFEFIESRNAASGNSGKPAGQPPRVQQAPPTAPDAGLSMDPEDIPF